MCCRRSKADNHSPNESALGRRSPSHQDVPRFGLVVDAVAYSCLHQYDFSPRPPHPGSESFKAPKQSVHERPERRRASFQLPPQCAETIWFPGPIVDISGVIRTDLIQETFTSEKSNIVHFRSGLLEPFCLMAFGMSARSKRSRVNGSQLSEVAWRVGV